MERTQEGKRSNKHHREKNIKHQLKSICCCFIRFERCVFLLHLMNENEYVKIHIKISQRRCRIKTKLSVCFSFDGNGMTNAEHFDDFAGEIKLEVNVI